MTINSNLGGQLDPAAAKEMAALQQARLESQLGLRANAQSNVHIGAKLTVTNPPPPIMSIRVDVTETLEEVRSLTDMVAKLSNYFVGFVVPPNFPENSSEANDSACVEIGQKLEAIRIYTRATREMLENIGVRL